MGIFKRVNNILLIVTLVLLMSACSGTPVSNTGGLEMTSKLTSEQATAIAENALQGYNTGDYDAWSRDWSETMKGAIKEADFLAFREHLLGNYGKYQSIAAVELTEAKTPGSIRWVITGNFERGQVRFSFVFSQDGDKVEGLHAEPIS